MKILILKIILIANWIVPATLYSQDIERFPDPVAFKKENPKRTHCMPWEESYKLHEMAARSIYNDSIIQVREGTIITVEEERDTLEILYNELLYNATVIHFELEDQIALKDERIVEQDKEIKKTRRKLTWANIRTGLLTGLGIVVTWAVVKD